MTHQIDNDETSMSLIRRAQVSDETAWLTLTEVYGPLIYFWCRKNGLSPDDAADIFQEVFRALAKHLPTFRKERDTDSFRGWLWTITRNKIRDLHKVRNGKAVAVGGSNALRRLAELPEELPSDLSRTGETGLAAVIRQIMDSVCETFEPKTWQAFWRVAIDDIPAAVVAIELEISIDSVYQAKSRVIRKLRPKLGDFAELIL
jgi:RNA polymerase sigma-70 factor (ECF subfamily)